MSVAKDEVLRIAQLAELHVDETALPALVQQMSRILDYVAQIATVSGSETAEPFMPGPAAAPLRADAVRPAPIAFGLAQMAPSFRDGFILVPRLGAFEREADAAADDE
jgi:aspartyl/glutamyl-tRNA(Asn/Gln) amidotransferase C subunit